MEGMVSSWEPIKVMDESTRLGEGGAHADVRGDEIIDAPGSQDGSPAVEDDQQAASH
jgi:hypothetical protein